MMEPAKLKFSAHEMKLVNNAEWILTKNEILAKVKEMLWKVNEHQKSAPILLNCLPEEITAPGAKISRGENYQGLPHMVLDYPRRFDRNHIFAIRHFFWWGKFFSTTLHISGKWQHHYSAKLQDAFGELGHEGFCVYSGADEWDHDATGVNYLRINDLCQQGFKQLILDAPFVKIAKNHPLNGLNQATETWNKDSEMLLRMLV